LAQQPDTTFKVDVKLVRMLVTVRNERGELVGGVPRDEFRITDNGVPQELAVFEKQSSQPLSISLLVDRSGSTTKERSYEENSLEKFMKALISEGNSGDTVSLYSFNYDVTLHAAFTRGFEKLSRELRSMPSGGSTSMYDALYLSSNAVRNRDGRHVIVVITDGGDTSSKVTFQKALEALQGANAVLYAVLVVPVKVDAGRNLAGENALIELTQWTGGRVFFPTLGESLNTAFAEILSDLRTQYSLGYYPRNVPATRERFHRVGVSVTRSGHTVTARNGYFSDSAVPR
jgi:Ca-activated chloride channel family protein